ncbi:MAG TPA: hypothetical protein VLR92_07380 [Blastocatellia bacterium]|nr:hypothetical protein [Blastocatellia bacterium]
MRQAFVLKLGTGTEGAKHHFEGTIEEVDTGRELRFKATEELLEFLAERFEKSQKRAREPDEQLRK